MRFLKSAPSKTPIYQISSKSDKLLDFGLFWGTHPQKNISFLAKKSSDQNFDVIFGFTTFERHYKPSYSKIRCDLDVG